MKRLLAFLFLCLPIYLFAQGFGSFSHDQPYFAKDRFGNGLPTASVYGWWTASLNLTNSSGGSPPADGESLAGWGIYSGNFGRPFESANPYYPTFVAFGGSNYLGSIQIRDSYSTARQLTVQETGGYTWSQPLTFFVMVKVNANNPNGTQGIVSGLNADFYLTQNDGGNFAMYAGSSVTGPTTIQNGKWYLVTCVYDGANSYMRTNGADYVAGNVGANAMAGIFLGKRYELNDHFFLLGEFSDFAFYNRRLTTNEITQVENAIVSTNAPVTLGSWNPTTNASLLSAYDIRSISANNGDSIASIPDLGPKGYHLKTVNSPKYLANAATNSGIPHIGFNVLGGANQMAMTNFTTTYPQPTTVIMVIDSTETVDTTYDFILDNCNTTNVYTTPQDFYKDLTFGVMDAGGTAVTSNSRNMTNFCVYEFYYNGASSYIRTNNINRVTGNPGTNGRTGIAIAGSRGLDYAHVSPMNFYWAGFYTNTLSSTERSNIYYYLYTSFKIRL